MPFVTRRLNLRDSPTIRESDHSRSPRRSLLFVNSVKFWGGGEQWFLQSAAALRDRGHEVHVAGRRGGVFLARNSDAGLPTLGLRLQSDASVLDVLRIRRWLLQHRPACVLCNFPRDIRIAGTAARSVPGTTVIWVMGVNLLRDRWRDRFWIRHCVDRLVVPSVFLANELKALPYISPTQIEVLPIGLDQTRWLRPGAADVQSARQSLKVPDGPIVGIFARLDPRKGHEHLLAAWPNIVRVVPSAHLWIVGSGPEEERLRALADSHGDRIRFWGFVPDVRTLMSAVDLVVQPSLYEAFGITLLEAMASCRPIVCTAVGGMGEVVDGKCAVIVPPSNPESLGKAIVELLKDPGRSERMGTSGRQRFEARFTLNRMIDRLEAIVQAPRH